MALPEIIKDIETRVKDTGDTMTGNLHINTASCPGLYLRAPNGGYSNIFKNSSATVEDGTHIRDIISNNNYLALLIKANNGIANGLSITDGSVTYKIYHQGNKPTLSELKAVKGSGSSALITQWSQLNLSASTVTSVRQIVEAMPAESVASLMCYADLKTNGVTPSGYGMLRIFKYNNNYAACEFSCSDTAESWSGYVNTGSGAGIYWSGWQKVLFINGGTLIGALNFASNTWNKIGDDVQIGDANVAGTLCIQGLNGTTAIEFRKYNDLTNFGRLMYDGSNFIFERNIYLQTAAPSFNIYDTTTKRLFQFYTDDNENALILNFKSSGNFTQLGLLAEKYGSNDIAHLYRYVNGAAEEYNILHSGNFSNYAVPYRVYHAAGTDFNTITSSGFHRVANNNINCPPGADWGQLLVISGGGDTITQIYGNYSNGNLYTRSGNPPDVSGAGSWNAWKQIWRQGDAVTGAVWNDYAECREADTIDPGYVLIETGDDTLTKSTERLSPFAGVSSDTWGFSQGETDKAKTPIAVAGRVLVYPWQDRNNYKPGDCVCAAPDGKVDIMTREEVIQYPDRIVGTVSSVPTYDKWGGGEAADRDPVDVNGRIWIKVR